MALTKELLRVLDNKEEPLPKRLKLADNAFKSAELPIQHREAILLKWLGKATKTNDKAVWGLLLEWLKSQQMQDLNRNEISREDVRNLMNVITKRIKNQEDEDMATTLNCITTLIENRNFQLCFKYDLEEYCKFISTILFKINKANLHNFITNEQLFNRNLISGDEFYKTFIDNTLGCLANVTERFQDDKIFQDVSKLVEKCLFHRNYKNFAAFLKVFFEDQTDEKPPALPKLLLKFLKRCYAEDPHPEYAYKLIFNSYCASYNNNFEMIYKFFIILTATLGFDVATYFNLSKIKKFQNTSSALIKSVAILNVLSQVLAENTIELSFKVNDKTFTEFLQNLTMIIVKSTKPNPGTYEFLNLVITLDPLIIEKILSDVLVYIMLSNKKTVLEHYVKFLKAMFEVFAKLHRIPNLIAKMIPTLKSALEGTFTGATTDLQFVGACEGTHNVTETFGDMMPAGVLNYFTQCITTLASWQVMNLFKTLFFHLETAVNNDLSGDVTAKVAYIELISVLMCQFLSSVRIAEHTVTTAVVEKFVNTMDELKEVLGKFGTALVNMEHNPVLMRAYLNICYAWGELYLTLAYYSMNNEVTLQKTLDSDSSACNITYLHPYLTRDQWCLISQRITNFGEKPCKLIMQKLYIQKLKALSLFEESVAEETISSIRTSISSTVEDNWKDVIFDQLVLDQIIKSNNLMRVAELILQDVIDTNNLQQLKLLLDCKELMAALLYTCVSKINKLFGGKRKHKQSSNRIPMCTRIFPYVTENGENLKLVTFTFVKELKMEAERSSSKTKTISINEQDLSNYLDVLKAIPVLQFDFANVQNVLLLYLMCVLLDLRCCTLQNGELIEKCENIIISLGQNYSGSFKQIIKPFRLTQLLIDNFTRYLDLFTFITQNILKSEDKLESFRSAIDFLTKNIRQNKYLQCSLIALQQIQKYKKSKFTAENKNLLVVYQEEIFKSIFKVLIRQKDSSDVAHLTEAYALTLKHYLPKNSNELSELVLLLDKYIDGITHLDKVAETKGTILLFTTILRNKSQFKDLQADIVMKAWTCCQNLKPDDKEYEDYSKLVMLIFEHIPNEQFSAISTDLLTIMVEAIKENPKQFAEHLKIWNAILGCDFNSVKIEMWQKVLSSLLLDTILVYLKDDKGGLESIYEDVVKLEINIMQNLHLLLTAPLVEAILITVSIIISSPRGNFTTNFTLCISLMETLLKYRNPLTMDYLPPYLQRYRALLTNLCTKSNSDLKLDPSGIQEVADCAHKLEKLTNILVACNRPIARISPYLIADILKQYEEITLYPNVKMHLNNCLYGLVTLCDQHAISYLMRILSTASTEMFKVIYENYKKYYKFTGKV